MSSRRWWMISAAAALVFVLLAVVALAPGGDDAGDALAVEELLGNPASTTTTTMPAVTDPVAPGTEDEATAPVVDRAREFVPAPRRAPVGLEIERLGVDAPVDPHGVDAGGQMDVPDNVTDVGWYRFGPSPGEGGSAVLAAHVDLAGQGPGVFYRLRELEPGDAVTVRYDDGSEQRFRVEARTVYEKDELPLDVIFSREGPPVLTLITCGGDFNRSIARYDSNVVVFAVPVENVVSPT